MGDGIYNENNTYARGFNILASLAFKFFYRTITMGTGETGT